MVLNMHARRAMSNVRGSSVVTMVVAGTAEIAQRAEVASPVDAR
jgi:hypothetical protein